MNTIKYTGWNPGLLKISLQRLLQDHANLSFVESKTMVDKILRGHIQEVNVEDITVALELLEKSREIGAVCELVTN